MQTLFQNLRYGIRMVLKNPGFSVVAIFTLALAVGANTAMFSLLNAVLLRPMTAEKPEEIVTIVASTGSDDAAESSSHLDFLDLRAQSRDAVGDLAEVSQIPSAVYLAQGNSTRRVWSCVVSANYFSMLGASSVQGRLFLPEDDLHGAAQVVLFSERAWRLYFAGDPNCIGTQVLVNDQPCTIIGIIPERAANVQRALQVDVFIPTGTLAQFKGGKAQLEDRRSRSFELLARLRPGVSLPQAQARFDVLAAEFNQQYPKDWIVERDGHHLARKLRLIPEAESRIPAFFGPREILRYLSVLGSVAALVLIIACVNLANLLFARAVSRRREMAVRVALGASRGQLVRQLLTENLFLGLLGGGVGLVLAMWLLRILLAWNPLSRLTPMLPPIRLELGLDFRTATFACVISILATLLFGLAPLLSSFRGELSLSLKERSKSNIDFNQLFAVRHILIIFQVAISLVLVFGAGLLLRGTLRAQTLDLGFDRRNLALLTIALDQRKDSPEKTERLVEELRRRLAAMPGVEDVDLAFWVPLGLGEMNLDAKLDGYVPDLNEHLAPRMNLVGPRFFDTLRIPILKGRHFSTGQNSAVQVMINEAMAKRYWPGETPVGRHVKNVFGDFEIVGVAKTTKFASFTEEPTPMLFLPLTAWFKKATPPSLTFLVRTTSSPAAMLNGLRGEIQSFAPDLPVLDVKTMDEHLALRAFPTRLAASLAGVFGALVLLLAAIGLYGVMAYFVNQRTSEIGIRLALGAQRTDVLRLVLSHGLKLVAIGTIIGIIASLGSSRVLANLLFGIDPADTLTLIGVASLLTFVALLACWLPARRAARVDPMEALRYE